jgi:hypothetical protein
MLKEISREQKMPFLSITTKRNYTNSSRRVEKAEKPEAGNVCQ